MRKKETEVTKNKLEAKTSNLIAANIELNSELQGKGEKERLNIGSIF
jgi:hypothetical protein